MTTLYTDLALDPNTGDLDFSEGTLALITSNQVSLRQRLWVRFTVWQGDWFFDETLGFPYRTYISKKVMKSVLDNKIKQTVNLEPDVLQITDFTSSLNVYTRTYQCYFTVYTAEGEQLNLTFIGSDEFSYPIPPANGATLCGDEAWITWQNRLYYLVNFRLPSYGDVTWVNKWAGDVSAPEYALATQTDDTITTQIDQPIIARR